MALETYTLAWIIPYVRDALKQTGDFKFSTYANALFFKLEEAHVKGVVRVQPGAYSGGQTFQLNQMPNELRALVSEAFYFLFHKGYIAPSNFDDALNQPTLYEFRVTEKGRVWFQGEEPLPEDAEKYMKFLRGHVTTLDPVIDQYVVEALTAFDREPFFASAVMLGAASEKELYLLADSILGALKDAKKQTKLKSLLDRRKLLELFESVRDAIDGAATAKAIPYNITEGATTHLMSLFEAMRVQRNDAVHPMNAQVAEGYVRHSIQSFPYALAKSEEIRNWLTANPGSI